jgi:hypothetical protein
MAKQHKWDKIVGILAKNCSRLQRFTVTTFHGYNVSRLQRTFLSSPREFVITEFDCIDEKIENQLGNSMAS